MLRPGYPQVDNPAPTPSPHNRQGGPGAVERGGQDAIHDALPLLVGLLQHVPPQERADVVDHNVEASVPRKHLLHQIRYLARVRNIGSEGPRRSAAVDDAPNRFLRGGRLGEVVNDDYGPMAGEGDGDAAPQAPGASVDHGHTAAEHGLYPSSSGERPGSTWSDGSSVPQAGGGVRANSRTPVPVHRMKRPYTGLEWWVFYPIGPVSLTCSRIRLRCESSREGWDKSGGLVAGMRRQLVVGILLFDQVEVLDFAGPYEVFAAARDPAGTPYFRVLTVAEGPEVCCRGGLRVRPDVRPGECPELDILLVPGGPGARQGGNQAGVVGFIQQQSLQNVVIASVCTGAFLLARAGLLNNRRTTTHSQALEQLRAEFPDVEVVPGTVVDTGAIITAGGVSSGINLALHLLERCFGPAARMQEARRLDGPWA